MRKAALSFRISPTSSVRPSATTPKALRKCAETYSQAGADIAAEFERLATELTG
jgi:hypothetical protein